MVQTQLDADIPVSRQLTLTLPPDTPVGRARVLITVIPVSEFPRPGGTLPHYRAIDLDLSAPVHSGQLRIVRDGSAE